MSTMSPQPPSVDSLIKGRRPLRNVHREALQTIGRLDQLALWITVRVGSMALFLCILGWTACWLG
jgi:hypothetical protein